MTWLERCQPGFINIKSEVDRTARARQYFTTYIREGKLPELPVEAGLISKIPERLSLRLAPHPSQKVRDHLSNLERELFMMDPTRLGSPSQYDHFQTRIRALINKKRNKIDKVIGWYLSTMIFRSIDLMQTTRSLTWKLMLFNLSQQLPREGFNVESTYNLIEYILSIFAESGKFYGQIFSNANQVQRLRRRVETHLARSGTTTREAADRAIVNACSLEILMDLVDRSLKLEVQDLNRILVWSHTQGTQWGTLDIIQLSRAADEDPRLTEWGPVLISSNPDPILMLSGLDPEDCSLVPLEIDPYVQCRLQTLETMSDYEKLVMYVRIRLSDSKLLCRENLDPQRIPKAVSWILEPPSLPPVIKIRGSCSASDMGYQIVRA